MCKFDIPGRPWLAAQENRSAIVFPHGVPKAALLKNGNFKF